KKSPEVSSHEIMFATPSGVQYSETVKITFESTFAIGVLGTSSIDIDENSGNDCSAGSWSDLTMAASSTAHVNEWGLATTTTTITLTAPTSGTGQITAGRCMRIQIGTSAAGGTNLITNATSAGSKTVAFTGTFGDTGTTTVQILDDDQVAVSAEVPQSLSFSISSSTIAFGNLYSNNDRYANDSGGSDTETLGHMLTAGTNASSGYAITVKGATLTSGSNTITAIGSAHAAVSTGSEQFGIRISASGGDGVVSDPYDDAAQYAYGATASVTDVIATATESTANMDYSVRYVANIASDTEAGSYSTTLTYVGTANF
ncbi:MAG: hypothetical protein KAI72_05075, partial [Candidatus Pacebacteria bacterium]|nr:hypothetical protein [Candidatus Paceibacterota bacterium]